MAGLQITSEADLEAFKNRCSPRIRQQINDQLAEQNNRHNPEPTPVVEEVPVVVSDPVPPRRDQPLREPVPPVVTEEVDPVVVAVKRFKEVPKRYWVVLLICVKTLLSCTLPQCLLLGTGMYCCIRLYLWNQRRKDRRILKALERQSRQRELRK